MRKIPLLSKLACVGIVVCVVFPLGRWLYPSIAESIGSFPFSAIEAVASATLGLLIQDIWFG